MPFFPRWVHLLFFDDEARVARPYAIAGFSLMALKYVLDSAAVFLVLGVFVSPLTYLSPTFSSKASLLAGAPSGLGWALALLALPFAWVGLSLTVRRVQDAGRSTWLAFLFLVPGLNYLLMLGLCLAPTRPAAARVAPRGPGAPVWSSAMLGVFGALVFSALMVLFSVEVLKSYGAALFLGAPVAMGAISAFTLNRRSPQSLAATLGLAVFTSALAAGTLLLYGLEGALCITMAFPPALVFTVVGAVLGRTAALQTGQSAAGMWMVSAWCRCSRASRPGRASRS